MKLNFKAVYAALRQCPNCLGCKTIAKWKASGEKMLVNGKLTEIATLVERKPCDKCNGEGRRW